MTELKGRKGLSKLSIIIPTDLEKWMLEIKDATGASLSYQCREGMRLFAQSVKQSGMRAIYPAMFGKTPCPPEKPLEEVWEDKETEKESREFYEQLRKGSI